MHRPRHRPRRSARLYFPLLSVLALVVFACLPALAQAECTDSSCAQYEVEIPSPTGKKPKPGKPGGSEKEPQAEISTQGEGGKKNGGETPSGEENSEETEEGKGTAPPGKDNGGGGSSGDKSGSPGGNAGQGGEKLGQSEALPGTASGQQASHSSGGSSPLVPILIAVAVLAAISIGALIYRQRRQGSGGSGSPVSPNA